MNRCARNGYLVDTTSALPIDPSDELVLRSAPNPLEPEGCFLELRVSSKSGKTASGRWIKQRSNKQVAAFLRQLRTPNWVLRTMNALLQQQEQDGSA